MAKVIPFKGLRFNTQKAGKLSELCCPPYDVISDEQRREFLNANEHNIIRLELPKGDLPYEKAAQTFESWKQDEILIREEKPAFYAYEEEFTVKGKRRSIKGIIARVRLEEFSKGIILPHEFTLSKAKEDRLKLMKATNCNFSQIYALYIDGEQLIQKQIEESTAAAADMEFTDGEGVTHRMWIITDEEVTGAITKAFDDKKLYIADGHHRYETALNYRGYCRAEKGARVGDACDYQMIFLMNMEHPGLEVFPTHRLIRGLPGFNAETVIEKCREHFDVCEMPDISRAEEILEKLYNENKKAFGFYCGDKAWYCLTLKDESCLDKILPDISKASRQLDVTVLHTLVLEEILGIDKENMEKQINLTYTKIFEEAVSGVEEKKYQCAFILNPTRVSQIRQVASNGEKMPQKSTYFYPKAITGMVLNELD